jgi:hypothetical protein
VQYGVNFLPRVDIFPAEQLVQGRIRAAAHPAHAHLSLAPGRQNKTKHTGNQQGNGAKLLNAAHEVTNHHGTSFATTANHRSQPNGPWSATWR